MKTKPRWMKSLMETVKTDLPALPYARTDMNGPVKAEARKQARD